MGGNPINRDGGPAALALPAHKGASEDEPVFLTAWRGEVRARPVSTRRAPLDDPHLINEAYSDSTLSTASKRNEVMAGLLRAAAVRW